jgi:hypothetical protein
MMVCQSDDFTRASKASVQIAEFTTRGWGTARVGQFPFAIFFTPELSGKVT